MKHPEHLMQLPVYRKIVEVIDILNTISEVSEELDSSFPILPMLITDAHSIAIKIRMAEEMDTYENKFENAMLIKVLAKGLQIHSHNLAPFNICEERYAKMLYNEMDIFRKHFIEWVAGLERNIEEDFEDKWDILRFVRN